MNSSNFPPASLANLKATTHDTDQSRRQRNPHSAADWQRGRLDANGAWHQRHGSRSSKRTAASKIMEVERQWNAESESVGGRPPPMRASQLPRDSTCAWCLSINLCKQRRNKGGKWEKDKSGENNRRKKSNTNAEFQRTWIRTKEDIN